MSYRTIQSGMMDVGVTGHKAARWLHSLFYKLNNSTAHTNRNRDHCTRTIQLKWSILLAQSAVWYLASQSAVNVFASGNYHLSNVCLYLIYVCKYSVLLIIRAWITGLWIICAQTTNVRNNMKFSTKCLIKTLNTKNIYRLFT